MSKSMQHFDRPTEKHGPDDDLFDEAFLASVDRQMLLLKENDPFRLQQLPNAIEADLCHDRSALIHQDRPKDWN